MTCDNHLKRKFSSERTVPGSFAGYGGAWVAFAEDIAKDIAKDIRILRDRHDRHRVKETEKYIIYFLSSSLRMSVVSVA